MNYFVVKKPSIDASKVVSGKKRKKATVVIKKGGKKAPVASKTNEGEIRLLSMPSAVALFIPICLESKEKEKASSNVIRSMGSAVTSSNGVINGNESSDDEDYSDDDEEGEDGYRAGGYHPVNIGDKFNGSRYTVVEKLGWGHFSTVWMCHDKRTSTSDRLEFVAMKVQKSASHYREAAFDEIELLKCVAQAMKTPQAQREFPEGYDFPIVKLVDSFDHTGPNGMHVCMVFEMLGENLLSVIKKYNYKGIPISIVKNFVKQICVGLDFLHRHCNIIHTDLKPENVLVSTPPVPSDTERILTLVGGKNGSASSLAKSKTKKKGKKGISEMADNLGHLNLQDGSIEKDLTAEEKKKLKKKAKRKRQMQKKQEAKKAGRRGKARGGPRGSRDAASATDHARLEMMMMERESIPIQDIKSVPSQSTLDDVGPSNAANLRSTNETRGSIPENHEREDCADVVDLRSDDETSEKDRDETAFRKDTKQLSDSNNSGTSLLRPSVFAQLNFDRDIADDALERYAESYEEKMRATGCQSLRSIDADSYVKPINPFLASLPMILPLDRMIELFGVPHNADFSSIRRTESSPGSEDIPMDWYFIIERTAEFDEDTTDDMLTIHVRTNGRNMDYIGGLVASCILHPDLITEDEWGMKLPDQLLIFELLHHATVTEHLVTYIEARLSGFYFLVHHHFPHVSMDEEDGDILYFARQMCKHPMSTFVSFSSEAGDDSADVSRNNEDFEGGGVLIGLDLDKILHGVLDVHTERMLMSSSQLSHVLKRVRDLSERVNVFISDGDYLRERERDILAALQTTQKNRIAGYDSLEEYESDREGMPEEQKEAFLEAQVKRLNENYSQANVKVVDLGNACWTHKHYTDDIQTRQYRAPEVLIAAGYDTSADMWSLACMTFELLTGDLMFDPRAGKSWNREEDHLALIIELVGKFPRALLSQGKQTSEYFTKSGDLRHIQSLNFWGLRDVLHEKYHFSLRDAGEISDFLEPILEVCPIRSFRRLHSSRCIDYLLVD